MTSKTACLLIAAAAAWPCFTFAELVGTPIEREVSINTSELGDGMTVTYAAGSALFNKFLQKTTELGGTYKISQQQGQIWILHHKKAGEDLADLIVHGTRGCESLDENCRRDIQLHNRNLIDPFASDFAGRIMIPERKIVLNAKIQYGNGFRKVTLDHVTIYYVKKDIQDSLRILSNKATSTPAITYTTDSHGEENYVRVEIEP